MAKVHFIGICGAGMSATAKLLRDSGWQVSGSDSSFYPPVSTYLKKNNIPFVAGYRKQNIPKNVDMIVIGKHAGLSPETNEEVKQAFDSGVSVKSFPEVLNELILGKDNIVITGSYGKSTCAALVAWCLQVSGRDPSYFFGAIAKTPPESSKLGTGNIFVLEGDEYPSSNWDPRSKFLHYRPKHVLLTSLEHDHVNIFKTVGSYRKPFKDLVALLPKDGTLTACIDGDGIPQFISRLDKKVILYGLSGKAPWNVRNLKFGEKTSFDIVLNNRKIVSVKTTLLGRHNVENILGTSALLFSLGLTTPAHFKKAIASFQAIERRLDRKSEKTKLPIYEGFGSSYAKARSAILAAKLHFPHKKLLVLFEPHTFSWRNPKALPWYDSVFDGVDLVLIYKPPKQTGSIKQLNLREITGRVSRANIKVKGFGSAAQGLDLLKKNLNNDSMLLILSSGGFDGLIGPAVKVAESKFPKQ